MSLIKTEPGGVLYFNLCGESQLIIFIGYHEYIEFLNNGEVKQLYKEFIFFHPGYWKKL